MPSKRICKSLKSMGLGGLFHSTVTAVLVGFSRPANFFHENSAQNEFCEWFPDRIEPRDDCSRCCGKLCGIYGNLQNLQLRMILVCCGLMSSYTAPRHRI